MAAATPIFSALAANRRIGGVVVLLALLLAAGLAAAHRVELSGHAITGMTNHVVWGLPHVCALFLIIAASGALNVASLASVFGRAECKNLAPLSALLALALLVGGLSVLVLDLGRPDRLLVAMVHQNPTSIFAWNIGLYVGFLGLGVVYLGLLIERRLNRFAAPVGLAAFLWRLVLTSGTGLIFGLLVARPPFHGAMMAPLFIAMSLAQGGAVFLLVARLLSWLGATPPAPETERWLGRLLGAFVAIQIYCVLLLHVTHLYAARDLAMERFLLRDGGLYPLLFWGGLVLLAGAMLPLLSRRARPLAGAALTVAGGLVQLYALLIGGQAVPLDLLPGRVVRSEFGDGLAASYFPSLPEAALGLGGVALALLLVLLGCRVLRLLPEASR
jgi:molybdopterin-containing oxidoreductase family membrane subunit